MVHCLAVGCNNTYKNTKTVSFYKLPDDEGLRKLWLAKIKREDKLPKPENCFVCSDHFTPDDFTRDLKVRIVFSAFLKDMLTTVIRLPSFSLLFGYGKTCSKINSIV